MSKEHLSTYLNDHLMGAVAALEIVDHLAADAGDLKDLLIELKGNIESDRQKLVGLMKGLGISESRVRRASGWIAGQFAEAKFEVDDQENGMLRRLERLEALSLGIDGKLALWKALEAASAADERLGILDYPQLAERARDQRYLVEQLRIAAARSALTIAA